MYIMAKNGRQVILFSQLLTPSDPQRSPFEPSGTPSGTPSAGSGGYYGGGETGEDTDGDGGSDAASRDGDDSDTGSTSSASNASTAGHNSPIGAMVSLAALSLLAGGYVIVRRRKRA